MAPALAGGETRWDGARWTKSASAAASVDVGPGRAGRAPQRDHAATTERPARALTWQSVRALLGLGNGGIFGSGLGDGAAPADPDGHERLHLRRPHQRRRPPARRTPSTQQSKLGDAVTEMVPSFLSPPTKAGG